jgi:hypothetical protein
LSRRARGKQRRFGTGLRAWDPEQAFGGLALFSPSLGNSAYAIDMEGELVNQWDITDPGLQARVWFVELLENGHLFVLVHEATGDAPVFVFKGGTIMELDWQGNVVWDFADPERAFSRS